MALPRYRMNLFLAGAIGVLAAVAGGCERAGEATAGEAPPVAEPLASPAANLGSTAADPLTRVVPAAPAPASVNVAFDPPTLDFGFVAPGADASGSVAIRNLGDTPVRITSVRPTCKCTALNNIQGRTIAPDDSVNLDVALEGRSVTGARSASVKITFAGSDQVFQVNIKAEVARAVRANPPIFNLATGETAGHVVVESVDGRTFNVLAANGKPPKFVGFEPGLDEPRSSYVLQWDLTQEVADDDLPAWWVIETDHPESPLLDTWVRHRSTINLPPRGRQWRVPDLRLLLGLLKPGEATELAVDVKSLAGKSVYGVRPLSSNLEAELVTFTPRGSDGECTVRVTPRPGVTGLFYGQIEFIVGNETQSVDVIGKVIP